MALPRLVIRKVEKSQVVLNANDALSQLHKCAFFLKDTDQMYLCLSQDRIIQFQATLNPNEMNKEIINDGACWTIISTDQVKYTWYESMGPPREPVSLIPIVDSFKYFYDNEKPFIELKGENFNSNLKVWFDDIECDTFFK
jgi:recombining binding protein suppressor of hairless